MRLPHSRMRYLLLVIGDVKLRCVCHVLWTVNTETKEYTMAFCANQKPGIVVVIISELGSLSGQVNQQKMFP